MSLELSQIERSRGMLKWLSLISALSIASTSPIYANGCAQLNRAAFDVKTRWVLEISESDDVLAHNLLWKLADEWKILCSEEERELSDVSLLNLGRLLRIPNQREKVIEILLDSNRNIDLINSDIDFALDDELRRLKDLNSPIRRQRNASVPEGVKCLKDLVKQSNVESEHCNTFRFFTED